MILMKTVPPIRLTTLKREAKLTHKQAQRLDPDILTRYAHTFPKHNYTLAYVQKHPTTLKLTYAYEVVAKTYEYPNWKTLREHVIHQDMLYRKKGVPLVHAWFSSYTQARKYHQKNKGYLLRFWNDYIVCGREYIHLLQMENYTHYWQAIDHNWVVPQDRKSFQHLMQIARKSYLQYQNS